MTATPENQTIIFAAPVPTGWLSPAPLDFKIKKSLPRRTRATIEVWRERIFQFNCGGRGA
jgi:hypothetical protein